ncbi:hypothetical protein DITRI_Ditri18aG0029100 [Diplodiscus trichospermus]
MELPTKVLDTKDKKSNTQADELSWFLWKEEIASKCILKNVYCEARAGEIMAIAGPSGAGKTTLLQVRAGMIPLRRFSGDVLVNNQPMDTRHFRKSKKHSCIAHVSGCMMGTIRPQPRVRELLKELGLEHVAKVRVGGESNRGISGGEKRVSIGIDLVHDPAVLLIDEPTSGLDSASALHVALLLKSMAMKQGKTIVLTTHQPGFRILELFDQALLLSNGTVLHQGSLHLLEQRLQFSGHSIPRHVNILEFAIEVTEALVIDTEASEAENADVEQDCEDTRRNFQLSNVNENNICYANPLFKEVLILGQRFSSNIYRTKQLFIARTVQAVIAGIVLGTIFMNAASDSTRSKLQTQIGFFTFSLTFLLSSTTEGLPIYLQERRILMRETSRGAYRISSYVITHYGIRSFPVNCGSAVHHSCILASRIKEGTCFSALVPNFIMGSSLIAGLIGSFFLFSGYFISKEDRPSCWIFMHYLSLLKYPLECLMLNEYGGEKGQKRCLKIVEGECYLYGEGFLMQQGLKESQKWSNIAVMLSFIVGYRFLSILILSYSMFIQHQRYPFMIIINVLKDTKRQLDGKLAPSTALMALGHRFENS